jgi:hypothetical protein
MLLALLVLAGLARGAFWVLAIPVWHPGDEAQHYAYVASLARGDGIPVLGEDRVPEEVTRLAKRSPTFGFRSLPVAPTPHDPAWGATREQYEAVQPPLYYALLALPYRLVRPAGVVATLYALRVVTLLVSLTAIPLTWLLARQLFPTAPSVAVAAPALLVAMQAYNANGAYVTNDALVPPLAVAALLPAAAALRRGPTTRLALASGVLAGLALLTKANAVALLPVLAFLGMAAARVHGRGWGEATRWAGVCVAVAVAAVVPWLAWTASAYEGMSIAQRFGEVIVVAGHRYDPAGLVAWFGDATRGLFDFEPYRPAWSWYTSAFLAAAAVATAAGVGRACWRRDGPSVIAFVALAAVLPLAFATLLALLLIAFAGAGGIVGRYLNLALPPLAIATVAGAVIVLGRRCGLVAVAALAALALTAEVRITRAYLDTVYTAGAFDGFAVAVDQSWSRRWAAHPSVAVDPPCPVELVALTVAGPAPAQLAVRGQGAPPAARRVRDEARVGAHVGYYRLPAPLDRPFTLTPPAGTLVGAARDDRAAALALDTTRGDPVARLYCAQADARSARFAQLYRPLHPDWVTYRGLRAAPVVWQTVAVALLVAALVSVCRGWRRAVPTPPRDRRPRGSDRAPGA